MDQLIAPPSHQPARQRRLGVVDGLGPHTTARFYRLLCDKHRALTGGSSPDVVVHSISVQRRLVEVASAGAVRPENSEALRHLVARTCRSLAGSGADVIAVACNATTVDPAIATSTCIGMVEATGKALRRLNARRVGLLASSIMVASAAYERGLADAGITVVAPAAHDQEVIDRFIESLRWSATPVPVPASFLRAVTNLSEGVDAVVLDCAEFSGVVDTKMAGKPVIDSVSALVDESCRALLDPAPTGADPASGPSQRGAGELLRVGYIP